LLNRETLKHAIGYLIAEADLSFQFVEKQSFCDLLALCNDNISSMMVKADAMHEHMHSMFVQFQQYIKEQLCKVDSISFTSDAWTAPNIKSLMGITAHWITKDWELCELLLAVPAVKGKHALGLYFIIDM
jgi:hypothetical protein